MSHTPGPWRVVKLGTVTEVAAREKTPIVSWMGFDDSNRSLKDHRANARLIAAAPELLEACKAARKWLDRFGQHAPIVFGGEQDLNDLLCAAIAKAKGENVPQK